IAFEHLIEHENSLEEIPVKVRQQLSKEALYASYIERQKRDVALAKRDEERKIPDEFDYDAFDSLSNELKAKLIRVRPGTLAHAGRIDGMTPAALMLILARIRQENRKRSA
ncbi:MAG: tRNA uridine-5-carboxymethylaminomethyl(34) synthesis enzyme MnmG, partial [Halocynthiibacter sp.]